MAKQTLCLDPQRLKTTKPAETSLREAIPSCTAWSTQPPLERALQILSQATQSLRSRTEVRTCTCDPLRPAPLAKDYIQSHV